MAEFAQPLVSIFQEIVQKFSLNELQTLSFVLSVNWDALAGDTIEAKAISLMSYLAHRQRFDELITELRQARPKTEWPEVDVKTLLNFDFEAVLSNHVAKTSQRNNKIIAAGGGTIEVRGAINQAGSDNIITAEDKGKISAGEVNQRKE